MSITPVTFWTDWCYCGDFRKKGPRGVIAVIFALEKGPRGLIAIIFALKFTKKYTGFFHACRFCARIGRKLRITGSKPENRGTRCLTHIAYNPYCI